MATERIEKMVTSGFQPMRGIRSTSVAPHMTLKEPTYSKVIREAVTFSLVH